jgi:hypothetical protein
VPIDFTRLAQRGNERIVDPRDIFSSLAKRPWPYLRLEQGEVLEGWFNRRTERDLVIKQNTGGGKTVAGLLIAQSSINEGVGPAAYFASDTYLVDQVVKEAQRLGLETTTDPRDPGYISHEKILVATLQRLINGKSVFGLDGSATTLPLGTAIIDDAHAALSTVEHQFRVTIPLESPLYRPMVDLFRESLAQQSAPVLAEIDQQIGSALLRIPYWSWVERQAEVAALLVAAVPDPSQGTKDLEFQWPLVKDQLELCTAIVTGKQIEIRPPAPPIHKIPSLANATRRIFLTATLADDAVLVTDLAAGEASIAEAITPKRASDIGDRMILAPLELNPSQDVVGVRELAKKYAMGFPDAAGNPTRTPVNVVVLVPSDWAATQWAAVADRIWNVQDLVQGVADLKAGHVGLVVLANKYDGIDLAGDACRLLIVDGLPRSLDPVDRREAAALTKSHKVIARLVQRVEQGMGRGVRDGDDYCAVLLLGDDLTQVVHDPTRRQLFSPATRTQLDLSKRLADQLQGQGLDAVAEAIDLCLGRDTSWTAIGRAELATTAYESTARIRAEEVVARTAFDKAVAHDYAGAQEAIQTAINATANPQEQGWLMEQKAGYLYFLDQAEAQRLQLKATVHNHHVLFPLAGVAVERVRAAAVQAEGVAQYARDNFSDGLDGILKVRQILDDLQWVEDSNRAESAWEQLGLLLGFGSERPERRYGKGPDNLWAVAQGRDWIFELKTGAGDHPIPKRYVDQLGGHYRWHADEYSRREHTAVPVMIAQSAAYDDTGTPPAGARVVDKTCLAALKDAITNLAAALRPGNSWQDPAIVAPQLAAFNLTAHAFMSAYTVPMGPATRM